MVMVPSPAPLLGPDRLEILIGDDIVKGGADATDHQGGGEREQDDRLPGLAAQTTRPGRLPPAVPGHTSTGDAFMTAYSTICMFLGKMPAGGE